MKLRVIGYHGMTLKLKRKLLSVFPQAQANPHSEDQLFIVDTTLDQFYSKWADKFMVIRESNPDTITVAVTQHSSFGTR